MTEIQVRFNDGRIFAFGNKTLLQVLDFYKDEIEKIEKISFTLNGERVILTPLNENALTFEIAHNTFMNHPFLPGLNPDLTRLR